MSDNGNGYKPDYSVLTAWPVSRWKWPKIAAFIPWMQALPYADEVLPQFLEIARSGVPFIHLGYGYAERVMNLAAWEFLDTDYTHLLILDSDHKHPANIVQQLAKHVIDDPEKQIVGGLNFRRTPPYSPCALVEVDGRLCRLHEWVATDEPIEVDMIGSANLLIAREVFEGITPPWFLNEYNENIKTTGGYDTYFCTKAKEAGFRIWCDLSLCSPHMGSIHITERTFRSYQHMEPTPEENLINVKTNL